MLALLIAYLSATLLVFMLILAILVVAKQNEKTRGYDLFEDWASEVESLSELKGTE